MVDLNNALRKSIHTHKGLTSGEWFTGGVYGFLAGFAKVCGSYRATHAVLCLDSRPYLRSQEYADYKGSRAEPTPEELQRVKDSRVLAAEAAQSIGVPIWAIPSFEADDLMAYAALRERNRWDRVVIWSNDTDLFQLLVSPTIWIERINEVMTQAKLQMNHGLTPEQHLLVSALTGSHNDVPGIEGVGPITAKKIALDPAKLRETRIKHGDIIDRNLRLMRLPHPQLPANLGLPGRTGQFSARLFSRWCSRYDIRATDQMLNAFETLGYVEG